MQNQHVVRFTNDSLIGLFIEYFKKASRQWIRH